MHQRTQSTVKRQPAKQGKTFANHISDKVLISRIYKELLKLNKNTIRLADWSGAPAVVQWVKNLTIAAWGHCRGVGLHPSLVQWI